MLFLEVYDKKVLLCDSAKFQVPVSPSFVSYLGK